MFPGKMPTRFYLLLNVLALILVLTGCEGGPVFMRSGATLHPVPDGWFPLFSRHYAVFESQGLQLKVTGFAHHLLLNFDTIIVINSSDRVFLLCEECVKWSVFNGSSLRQVSLATIKGEQYVHDGEKRSFVIPPQSTLRLQGLGALDSLREIRSTHIRLDLQFTDMVGNKKELFCYFEGP